MPRYREVVAVRWRELTEGVQAEPAARDSVLAEIVAAYEAGGRFYHRLEHVAALLALSREYAACIENRDAVDLAIIFHDVVYEATRSDNEEESARFARMRMAELGFAEQEIERVERYVLTTKHGTGLQVAIENDLAYLLDFDLSILGASREVYATYVAAIRLEYAVYPDQVYRAGRAKVLRAFLAQTRIYRTELLYNRWEAHARENIAWELGLLQ